MDLIARRREIIAQDYHAIPAEYRRVDYIGAENNNAYINMGFYLTDELEAEIHYYNDKNEAFVFGARAGISSPPYCNINIEGSTNNVRFDYSTAKSQARWADYKIGEYAFSFKNNIVTIENLSNYDKASTSLPSLASTYINKPLLLFAAYTGNDVSVGESNGSLRIYSAKFWIGGNLVRNFVPCIRKSDNKAGMYDRITKSFYTNAGVDEFTAAANFNFVAPDIPTSMFVYKASDGLLSTDSRLYSVQIDEGCSEQLVNGYLRISAPQSSLAVEKPTIAYTFNPTVAVKSKYKVRLRFLELPSFSNDTKKVGMTFILSQNIPRDGHIIGGRCTAIRYEPNDRYELIWFSADKRYFLKSISLNTWYTIEIKIQENIAQIMVDGELLYTPKNNQLSNYSIQTNKIQCRGDSFSPCTVEIDYIVFYNYDPIE